MQKFIPAAIGLLLTGCANIAQQALEDKEAASQVSKGEYRVTSLGIYRIWKDSKGNYYSSPLCLDDTKSQIALTSLKRIQSAGKPSKIEDQDAFDHFQLTLDPIAAERDFGEIKAKIGITFNGIPRSKRVAENFSISKYDVVTSNDELLNSEYVYSNVERRCRKFIDDKKKFRDIGKPVFVYSITTGEKVYSKLVGLPSLSVGPELKGKKIGEFKIGTSEVTYAEARNAVFGYLYFPVGSLKNEPVPTINRTRR
ncbi:hypothetical protein J2046_004453 [Rhizobium petrolearium]|uniref:hypothetical protein n=1 Tax=Neorhizobium petrolearium TaxID=515361 RepID=UPI001AE9EAC9|nr:hypothetical protein [Neorhizobium petrolearium]MBP1846179.1 hypothetical protein [Neorhizobium petrolearium]